MVSETLSRPHRPVLLLLCLLVVLGAARAQDDSAQELTIYAATSLTDVFEDMRAAFLEAHETVEIHLNFASSSTLAAQLLQGAPADVFASANELQMQNVVEGERIDAEAVRVFAHNQLLLIAPVDNPAEIAGIASLAEEAILLVLAAPGTPIRAYTDAMFLSHNEELGEGFSEGVMRNLASEESNVRQVVARVALGEADAGIVYQSDAAGAAQPKLLQFPIAQRHNQLASYPIAPLKDSPRMRLAERFIDFVFSAEAREILADNGFCAPAILEADLPSDAAPAPTVEAADAPEMESNPCLAPPSPSG